MLELARAPPPNYILKYVPQTYTHTLAFALARAHTKRAKSFTPRMSQHMLGFIMFACPQSIWLWKCVIAPRNVRSLWLSLSHPHDRFEKNEVKHPQKTNWLHSITGIQNTVLAPRRLDWITFEPTPALRPPRDHLDAGSASGVRVRDHAKHAEPNCLFSHVDVDACACVR